MEKPALGKPKRPFVMAMVLGTALSALAPEQARSAATETVTDLGRYCTACWRNARLPVDTWADCTQEVYRRLLERVPMADWKQGLHGDGPERQELVRAIDAVRKRVQRARKWSAGLDGVADRGTDRDRQAREDREAVRQAAANLLTARQQRILQMSFEGWSVQEMADELHTSPERISDEKYKAIRKLRAHLADRCA